MIGEAGWLWLAAAAGLPVLVLMALVRLPLVHDGWDRLAGRLRPGQRRVQADGQAIERLAADLRRLGAHLSAIESSGELHRAARLRAAALAYDDVLVSACRALRIDVAATTPLRPLERLETEAALAREGMIW